MHTNGLAGNYGLLTLQKWAAMFHSTRYPTLTTRASPCHACTALQSRPHDAILPAYYRWLVVAAYHTQTHLMPLQRLRGFMVSQ